MANTQFKDMAEFEDPDLHLMFRRKRYTVPAASFSGGRYLHKIFNMGVKAASGADPSDADKAMLNDDEEDEFVQKCLGAELLATLEADNVPYKVVAMMAQTHLMDTVTDRATALEYWNTAGKGKASKGRPTETPTQPAAASTTRKPVSPSTTKKPAKKAATSGPRSSKIGTS